MLCFTWGITFLYGKKSSIYSLNIDMGNTVKTQFADTWQKTLAIWFQIFENKIKADQQRFPIDKRETFYVKLTCCSKKGALLKKRNADQKWPKVEIEVLPGGSSEPIKRLSDLRWRILFGWSKFYPQNESFSSSQSSSSYGEEKTWARIRFWFNCKGKPQRNRKKHVTVYGSYSIRKRAICSRTVLHADTFFLFCLWTFSQYV